MSRRHVYLKLSLSFVLVTLAGLGAWAQLGDRRPIDQTAPPPDWRRPPSPPLSPEESMARMELPAGFRVELVAAEPLVQDPIAMAFDPAGDVWVVELPGYNWELRSDLLGIQESEPAGRVVRLQDSDGDGRLDKRSVFLDGLSGPRSIALFRDGVLVLDPPSLWFCRDRDGDGRAEDRVLIADDFGTVSNPHSSPNGLLLAQDNQLYVLRYPGRFRYREGGWERIPHVFLPGQWGMSQDDFGRSYYSTNGDHLRGDLLPSVYGRRNPNQDSAPGVNVQIGPDQTVWPHGLTPGVNRREHLRENGRLKRFTANSGPLLYRGDQFPDDFYGDVFLCESSANLIRRSRLRRENGAVRAENAYQEREFLFSTDERFRPVSLSNGPDGALYVVDMYRGIIEGRLFITTFLRNQILERGLHQPFHGLGRIYRIVHESRRSAGRNPSPELLRSAEGWVPLLAHPNGWWRDTAQRKLVERGERAVIPELGRMAAAHARPEVRARALWTLHGLEALEPGLLLSLLQDASPHLRAAALRLSQPWLQDDRVRSRVLSLAGDPELEVRRQLILTLGEVSSAEGEQVLAELARRDAEGPHVAEAVVNSLAGREHRFYERYLAQSGSLAAGEGARRLIAALASAVANSGETGPIAQLLEQLQRPGQESWKGAALLEGLGQARAEALPVLSGLLNSLEPPGDPLLRERLAETRTRIAEALSKAGADQTAPAPVTADQQKLLEQGRAQYALCSACHGPAGQGVPNVAPPLLASALVTGREEALIRVVLHGLDRSPGFADMPPLAGLADEQIAAILTYVRHHFGSGGRPVTPQAVAQVRAATQGRSRAWTETELRDLP